MLPTSTLTVQSWYMFASFSIGQVVFVVIIRDSSSGLYARMTGITTYCLRRFTPFGIDPKNVPLVDLLFIICIDWLSNALTS